MAKAAKTLRAAPRASDLVAAAEDALAYLQRHPPAARAEAARFAEYARILRRLHEAIDAERDAEAALAEKEAGPGPEPDTPAHAVVLELCRALDRGEGALWEDLLQLAAEQNLSEPEVEAAVEALMDKGAVFEPVVGRLRVT